MRFKEYLMEEQEQLGLAVGKKPDGSFYDIWPVDMKTGKISTLTGHTKNVFNATVKEVRRDKAWDDLMKSIAQKAKSSKKLGSEFTDEVENVTLYGPFSGDEIGRLYTPED